MGESKVNRHTDTLSSLFTQKQEVARPTETLLKLCTRKLAISVGDSLSFIEGLI